MKGKKAKRTKFGVPSVNPVELADELKRGITIKMLADSEDIQIDDYALHKLTP